MRKGTPQVGRGPQMQFFRRVILRLGWIVAVAILAGPRPGAAQEPLLYAAIGDITRPPIGWVEFCAEHASECKVAPSEPRNVVLTLRLWRDLARINQAGHAKIKPMTHPQHYRPGGKRGHSPARYGHL